MYPFATKYISIAAESFKTKPLRLGVVHPCSEFALTGALEVAQEKIATPVLIGPKSKIIQLATSLKLDLTGIEIVDTPHSHASAKTAVDMVNQGLLDILMKGSLHTDEFLKPVVASVGGLRTDRRITHCTVMDIPNYPHPLLVADIAINVAPDLEAKKFITQNAIDLALSIGIPDIKVAVLSADEQVRMAIPSTVDAACLSKMAERGQITGAVVDGPLAFDAAVSVIATKVKGIMSSVAGHADILICPSIEAGNILVKQLKYFSNAIMPGIVMGAKVPLIITSRADEALTRTTSCALAVIMRNYISANSKKDLV